MATNKHFRATHKETGEQIEFGLEDICTSGGLTGIVGTKHTNSVYMKYWLKDYAIEYQHEGEYYEYKGD